jgi:prepilin peptidase CpaA
VSISASAALWFLPFAVPIGIWVAWNDMAFMKIPNKAVIALMAVFVVIGLIALPFGDYLWRYLQFAVVLVVGFVLSSLRAFGAGDAKFAAAMAPFIDPGDWHAFLFLFTGVLVAALLTHRAARRTPAIRIAFSSWESWERTEFPMGLALGAALIFYLILGVLNGGT